jgi:membrane carboxypeptidase/penicillin-binding protein
MQNAYKDPSLPFKVPEGVIAKNIDHATGRESNAPDATTEYFKPGYYDPNPKLPEQEIDDAAIDGESGIY